MKEQVQKWPNKWIYGARPVQQMGKDLQNISHIVSNEKNIIKENEGRYVISYFMVSTTNHQKP